MIKCSCGNLAKYKVNNKPICILCLHKAIDDIDFDNNSSLMIIRSDSKLSKIFTEDNNE